MERKIGEVFTHDGRDLMVTVADYLDLCNGCYFYCECWCTCSYDFSVDTVQLCFYADREDKTSVIFKEV